MPRKREIRPGFFINDQLGECEPLARLLFAGMWCWADREGYLDDRPKKLRAEILPYDMCDGESLVQQLADNNLIVRGSVEGAKFIRIRKFSEHQKNIHPNEEPSRFLAGSKQGPSRVQAGPLQDPCPASSSSSSSSSIEEGANAPCRVSGETPTAPETPPERIPFAEIVGHLNTALAPLGRGRYRHTSKATQAKIRARWAEGHRLNDFKAVIDDRVATWGDRGEMVDYLRPETLFGTKFESYLDAASATRPRPAPSAPAGRQTIADANKAALASVLTTLDGEDRDESEDAVGANLAAGRDPQRAVPARPPARLPGRPGGPGPGGLHRGAEQSGQGSGGEMGAEAGGDQGRGTQARAEPRDGQAAAGAAATDDTGTRTGTRAHRELQEAHGLDVTKGIESCPNS